MADYLVGSESPEATEQHFAQVREELRHARIRALDAAHHGELKWCDKHCLPLNEFWECEDCDDDREAEAAALTPWDGKAF